MGGAGAEGGEAVSVGGGLAGLAEVAVGVVELLGVCIGGLFVFEGDAVGEGFLEGVDGFGGRLALRRYRPIMP